MTRRLYGRGGNFVVLSQGQTGSVTKPSTLDGRLGLLPLPRPKRCSVALCSPTRDDCVRDDRVCEPQTARSGELWRSHPFLAAANGMALGLTALKRRNACPIGENWQDRAGLGPCRCRCRPSRGRRQLSERGDSPDEHAVAQQPPP